LIDRYQHQQTLATQEEKETGSNAQNNKTVAALQSGKQKWWNMAMMLFCWIATPFTFYMFVFFIKYIPADIYVVSIVSGFSAIGYLL